MTTGQTIEAKIVVYAKQAIDEIGKFGARLSSISELAKEPIGSIDELQKGAKKLQEKLAPTAAAISGVASALGQAGGEAGKVVAGVGQMAAAFGAGGPWAVAIVGGTMLLDEYLQAEKQVEENARSADAALNKFGDNLVARSGKGLEFIRQKADEAAKAVQDFGKTSAQITEASARAEIAATEARLSGIDETIKLREKNLSRLRAEINDPAVINSRRDIIERMAAMADERKLIEVATSKRAELTMTLRQQQDETRRLITQTKELAGLEGGTGGGTGGGGARREAAAAGPGFALRFYRASQEAAAQRARAEQQANREAAQRDIDAASARTEAILKAQEDAEKAKTAIAKREAEERAKVAEAEHKAQVEGLTSFATSAATALGTFAGQLATGQEAALENLLSAAAVQAGGMVTLEGGKVLAAGIGGALLGNPAAPGQIAGGLGLVAAGSAIQAGGPAAVQALLGAASGASPSSATSAARDRGASPRSSSGGGSGGPLVINVSYGVGGPLPEDTAREIAKVMRTGDRRRGA